MSGKEDAGKLDDAALCTVAATLEVAEEIGVPIYDEIRARVRAAVAVTTVEQSGRSPIGAPISGPQSCVYGVK